MRYVCATPVTGPTYTYDTLNRLSTLASSWAGSFGFSYDALSRRTQMTRPNGVSTSYSYDNLSRLLSVLHQLSGSTIDGAVYTVDSAGNRTSKADELANVTTNYGYDSIYELLQATQGATTTESYTYDPVGNRLSSLGVSSYTNNSSNELTATSNASYTYDYNGNTASKTDSAGTTNYSWDYENRLTSVTLPNSGGTVTFKYDPFGRRIEKISPTTTSIFAYDGDNLAETVNASGVTVARYTDGLPTDELLAMQRGSTSSFYEADGLGSITSLTTGTGTIAQTYSYDAFGNITNSSGSLTNFFRFAGREFDTETGLYFLRARYLDATTGRFVSEDPWRFYSDVNFYPYVDNDPTVLVDPYGLYTCVGNAVCNFTPDMKKALDNFQKCLGRDFKITCGNDSHKPTDPHMKGLAVDIGHGTNPWLSRDMVVKCFNAAFPSTAYGEQEYDQGDSGEYQYHLQYTPGRGGATGFSPVIHAHGH